MSFFPYFVYALLGVDSLRGGLAEGNRIWVLGPGGGGGPKGLVHNLLMPFFTLGSSKIEVFETCFFDVMTI